MSRLSLNTNTTANDLVVNTGSAANSKNGDALRTAFTKLNSSIARAEANFIELYAATGAGGLYHLGDDVQFVDIDPNSGTVVVQSGFDTGMPVYIKGGNCSNEGVGGNVVIEAGGPGLPNTGTVGNIEMAAQQTTIDSNNNVWSFRDDGILELPLGGDIVDSDGITVLGGGSETRFGTVQYIFNTVATYVISSVDTGTNTFTVTGNAVSDALNNRINVDYGGMSIQYNLAKLQPPTHNAGVTTIYIDDIDDNVNSAWVGSVMRCVKQSAQPEFIGFDTSFTLNGDNTLSVVTQGGGASTGNIGFTANTMYDLSGIVVENSDLSHSATAALLLPTNSQTLTAIQLNNIYGDVVLQASNTGSGGLKTWTFGGNGSLTFPNGAKLDGGTAYKFATDNSVTQYIDLRDVSGRGFYTDSNGYTLRSSGSYSWNFTTDGKLKLPAGGDIVDSNGTTVLGGGNNGILIGTDNIHGVSIGRDAVSGDSYIKNRTQITNSIFSIIADGDTHGTLKLRAEGSSGVVNVISGGGTWTFDGNGDLTVPGDIKSTAGVGPVVIEANDGTLRTWTFGGNGNLQLPAGGDIVDSNGTTVLGGGGGIPLGGATYNLDANASLVINTTDGAIDLLRNGVTGVEIRSNGVSIYAANQSILWDGYDLKLPFTADIKRNDGFNNYRSVLGEIRFEIHTLNFAAVAGHRYGVNTTARPITATLPINPEVGDAIFFVDSHGTFATNNLTIDGGGLPNGKQIMGMYSQIISTDNENVGVFYNGTEWRLYA